MAKMTLFKCDGDGCTSAEETIETKNVASLGWVVIQFDSAIPPVLLCKACLARLPIKDALARWVVRRA